MYSALELHKEVLQGLQTVDAFSQDMFLPEELDFHLNKQQDSFVNELLDKGFADRQVRLDLIQNLISKNKKLIVWTAPESFYYESGAVNSFLPGDYKHLLSTRVMTSKTKDCSVIVEKMIEQSFRYTRPTLKTNLTIPPYYSKVEFVKIAVDQTETIIASVSMPVQDPEDTHLIVQNLLFQGNKASKNLEIYWEKYVASGIQSVIENNKFIFIDPDVTNSYRLDVYRADNTIDYSEAPTPDPITTFETWDSELLTTLEPVVMNSAILLDNDEIYNRKQNPFYFPKPESPHVLLSDGIIFVYYGNDFVPTETIIDYIRQPQPISLSASQGCELSESAARIIANRTVEYLKLVIENPAYKEVIQHNEIRDQK